MVLLKVFEPAYFIHLDYIKLTYKTFCEVWTMLLI